MQENLDTQASSNLQVTTPFVVDFASLSKALPQYLLAPLSLIPVSPPFNVEQCLRVWEEKLRLSLKILCGLQRERTKQTKTL